MNATTAARTALTATLRAAGATDIRPAITSRPRAIVTFSAAGDAIFPIMEALRAAADADRHRAIFTQADTEAGRYSVEG